MKYLERKNVGDLSLRELIEILIKHKILIMGIIVGVLIFSIIYSFFIAVPVYNAEAEVEINKANTGVGKFDKDYYSNAIIDALLKQMKDSQYTEQVSKVLESKNIYISNSSLMEIISSSKGKNGKTILLSAKYIDKKEVAHIVNASADVLQKLSAQYMREKIQEQLVITGERIELARKNVEAALLKYNENIAGQEGIDKQQAGISISEFLSEQPINIDLIDKLYGNDLIPSIEIYKLLKIEYNRLKLFEAYLNTNSNAYILSYAAEPESASWPNRKLIVIVSLIVGIGIASLSALTIEYFKNGK
ncbi:MAG TPA: Wzz/FepE/Etk N-terminal domain-containing protein [Bacillota bacterium]|nr:Wzz/FepE/Etk N-terminal domain-containing protein [Bacillota bacterium]